MVLVGKPGRSGVPSPGETKERKYGGPSLTIFGTWRESRQAIVFINLPAHRIKPSYFSKSIFRIATRLPARKR